MIAFFLFFVGILAIIFSIFFLSYFSLIGEALLIISLILFSIWFISYLVERYHKNISKPFVNIVRWIRAIILDFLCQSIVMCMIPFCWMRLRSKGDQTPVILIHGYFHFGLIFIYLFYHLRRKKIGPIYTFNLGSPRKSIEDYAKKLAKQFGHFPKMTLVGHSLGGLVAGYYSIHLSKKDQIEKLFTLGTPFHGTKSAYLGIGKCARQMEPGHPLPKQIYEGISSLSIPKYHLETEQDEIVPYPSVLSKENLHTITAVGHVGMLFTKKSVNRLYSFLIAKPKNK